MTPTATALFLVKPESHETPGGLARQRQEHDSTPAVHRFHEVVMEFVKDCDARLVEGTGIRDMAGSVVMRPAAGSEIAAQHAQAPLPTRITALEQELEQLRRNLAVERIRLAGMIEQLGTEKTGRARAEAALQEARVELGAVRHQLEAEQAERRRVATALETVQQALDTIRPSVAPSSPAAPVRRAAPLPARPQAVLAPAAAPGANQHAVPDTDPEQVELVQHLLEEAAAMYRSDLESGLMPIETVDRLTVNLRRVRESIERRFPEPEGLASAVFHQEVTALLDSKGDTAFGRHLSIAAHACAAAEPAGQQG